MADDFLTTLKSAQASLTQTAASNDKIHAYAHFMVLLAKLVKPTGELDPKLSEQLKKAMHATGIKKSCARRYIDNSIGAFKANTNILKAATSPQGAKAVLELFDALGIKTQDAIHKLGFKGPDRLDQLADQLAKLTPEQRAEVVFDRLTVARQRRETHAKRSVRRKQQVAKGKEPAPELNERLKDARKEAPSLLNAASDAGSVRYEANMLGREVIELRIELRIGQTAFAHAQVLEMRLDFCRRHDPGPCARFGSGEDIVRDD